jgi:hypothetical protein
VAGGLFEILADQLALLGQQLVEVLIDVLLADGFRREVEVLDLLKPACLGVRGLLMPVVACGIRRRVPSPAARRSGGRLSSGGRRVAGGDQRLERASCCLRYLRDFFAGRAVWP